jgi:hypothetical protein
LRGFCEGRRAQRGVLRRAADFRLTARWALTIIRREPSISNDIFSHLLVISRYYA